MKTFWNSLIEKHGSWWVGAFIGDVKYSFVCHPDYTHIPKSVRCKAASRAVMDSFHHLSFWIALVTMIGLIVGLSLIDGFFHVCDSNGTLGAILGFFIGELFLVKAIYRGGIESYIAGLPRRDKEAEQAAAGATATSPNVSDEPT